MKLKVNLQLSRLIQNVDLITRKSILRRKEKKVKITRQVKDRMV